MEFYWYEYKYHGRIMALIGLGAFIGDSFVRITIGFIQQKLTKYFTKTIINNIQNNKNNTFNKN